MEYNQYKELFERYLKNRCSEADIEQLVGYFKTDKELLLRTLIQEEIARKDVIDAKETTRLAAQTQSVYARIHQQIQADKNHNVADGPIYFRYWKPIAVAASIVLCLAVGAGLFLYKNSIRPIKVQDISAENDIQPGSNRATLTLADGSVVDLSTTQDGIIVGADAIKYEDGVTVDNTNSTAQSYSLLTLTTPAAGQYKITLADGTKVWLNAASTLRYPAQFGSNERRVELIGEAYFEVAKDTKKPFVAYSEGQTVTVLGTHFNISAYPNETTIKTTLLEGAVRVTPTKNAKAIELKPNQQAVLTTTNGTLETNSISVKNAVEWKNGDFNFEEGDFKSVMRKIARWYDVEVVYDQNVPTGIELGGWISRKNSLSKVLKWIESTSDVRFELEERRLLVKKK